MLFRTVTLFYSVSTCRKPEKGEVCLLYTSPDFFEHSLKKGDIILMCSDGLSNMIEDEEIFQIVKSGRDVVEITEDLIETANENGGKDNIGVVVIEPLADEVSIC